MDRPLTKNITPGKQPFSLKQYVQGGGYQSVVKAVGKMTPLEVQEEVRKSHLRGRGGAGFLTGMKWSFVPMGPGARRPKYLIVNADEMEPGTFKDRLLLEGDPHLLVEGVITSAYALEAEIAYIFIRGEYTLAARRVQQAIEEARVAGYCGQGILGGNYSLDIRLHASAGRYMCGEETGLINALEGRRAQPRTKPPYPQTSGLWGRPSVVNNVETLCNVPYIVTHGADAFKALARSADAGTKLYGVSGRVNKPGLWELPIGTTARAILETYAGGMKDGLKVRGVLPGGASTPFLTDKDLDLPMDFTSMEKHGKRMGTGTMIVLDDKTCPVGFCLNLARFFARESCGWCTPCREGLPWIAELLGAIEAGRGAADDLAMLDMHVSRIRPGHTFCALAPGAIDPIGTALQYFRDDFEAHVSQGRCPYGNPQSAIRNPQSAIMVS